MTESFTNDTQDMKTREHDASMHPLPMENTPSTPTHWLKDWFQTHPKKSASFGFGLLALGGLLLISGYRPTQALRTFDSLDLPIVPVATASAPVGNDLTDAIVEATVAPGQTLSTIGEELGIPYSVIHDLANHKTLGTSFTSLKPGDELRFLLNETGDVDRIILDKQGSGSIYDVSLSDNMVTGGIEKVTESQKRVRIVAGSIDTSLYGAGQKAGVSPRIINEMTKVFSYDIDFAQDLRTDDHFSVVFEELYRDGERVGSGDIIGATFHNRGKRYTALRHIFPDGRVEYFDETGRPLKKSFLRMPIEFARLSSTYGARRHPVLGRMKMHTGVDYAARTGTPIMSAGDGKVAFAGWKRGYGRTVIVDHGQKHSTLYAHMSKFGKYKTGAKVRQGEVLGYVGSSGLATGPHLHYEFRIGGKHKNPLKVTLPKPEPLPAHEMARFKTSSQQVLAQLDMADNRAQLAQREN